MQYGEGIRGGGKGRVAHLLFTQLPRAQVFSSVRARQRSVAGKVEEHWVELDLLGLMQQLGVLPEPEQSKEASPT